MHVIVAAQDSFLKYGLVVTAVDEDKELMRLHRRLPEAPEVPLLAPLVPPIDCVDIVVAPVGRYSREFRVYTRSMAQHARRADSDPLPHLH